MDYVLEKLESYVDADAKIILTVSNLGLAA